MAEQFKSQRDRPSLLDTLLLIITLGALFFILLGARPLFVPDEGRYAEIAREMVANNDFITPLLNGIKYFEKPILFYWLTAAAIKFLGLNLWAIRSVNAVLGIFCCLATCYTTRQLFDRMTGLLAAFILGTSFLYIAMTRMITLDLPVTCFLTCSLYAFLLGTYQKQQRLRCKYLFWAAFTFAALAVLTKGLIGIVLPCLIVGLWVCSSNQWRALKDWYLPSSILVFLAVTLPWHLLVQWRNPEFFDFYFIEQHILRYLSKDVGHYQPIWFFIPCVILGFFPWIIFLPQAIFSFIKEAGSQFYKHLFFVLWAIVIFVFFSLSKSKLIPYILPVLPPLAIITAYYLKNFTVSSGIKAGYFLGMIIAFTIMVVFGWFINNTQLPNATLARLYLNIASGIVVAGACAAFLTSFLNSRGSFIITTAYSSLFALLVFAALPAIDNRTIFPLIQILNQSLSPQAEIMAFGRYYQDLPFYLQRKVTVVNWQNELSFGMAHQPNHDWMLDDASFWRRWHEQKQAFVIMSLEDYKNILRLYPNENFILLGQTNANILAANKT